jgi:hypothetical protein
MNLQIKAKNIDVYSVTSDKLAAFAELKGIVW